MAYVEVIGLMYRSICIAYNDCIFKQIPPSIDQWTCILNTEFAQSKEVLFFYRTMANPVVSLFIFFLFFFSLN